ncbi:Scr1 family TA system antitoxin-like transcriptional regulator [Streptomyces uncialis]|uniref:helix-turn-helix domain-containing protein n=1 Tax=Streptomyces uncialis TaxID=1048205 RepID=UPI00386A9E10|nr:helix-turn-helix transcriptional regulator [Streptomyces uncialis]
MHQEDLGWIMNRKELDPQSSPRAAFGAQLRRSREDHEWIQDELAERMGYSGTHVSAVETCRKSPTLTFARKADEALGTGATFEVMWQAIRKTVLLEGFPEYLQEEAKVAKLRTFELGVIPGVFQTPRYAEALAWADVERGASTPELAAERVSLLKMRQRRLLATRDAPLVYAVLDESCLRRIVGGRDVMIEQLDHLVEQARSPCVTLQLVPFTLGHLRPLLLPVVLLTMRDRTVLGYTESASRGYLERDDDLIRTWEWAYDQLQAGALSPAASLDLIGDIRKELQDGR